METRPVIVVAYDGAELVDISCVTTSLHVANRVGAEPPYGVRAGAGISVRHPQRLFVGELGEPPGQAVRRIRLEVAARLLCTTDLPLNDGARRCGFSSAETLRQAFVSRYGTTPSQFRSTQSSTGATRAARAEGR